MYRRAALGSHRRFSSFRPGNAPWSTRGNATIPPLALPHLSSLHRGVGGFGDSNSGYRFLASRTTPTAAREEGKDGGGVNAAAVVYESPFGTAMRHLKRLSLSTGVAGGIGLPLLTLLDTTTTATTNGDPGVLALTVTFTVGTLGTTALIHAIFQPYVLRIERIPVRQCKSPPPINDDDETATKPSQRTTTAPQSYLYKATTLSLFVWPVETVFDPTTDLVAYLGRHPLANLAVSKPPTPHSHHDSTARAIVPLYLHADLVHDSKLRRFLSAEKKEEASAKLVASEHTSLTERRNNPDKDL